jgi:amino acid adenylation domain-containing protein
LFEAQAEQTPQTPAVVYGGDSITYGDLNNRADLLARHLRSSGVDRDVLVGLHVERSIEMVVAMLAIMKAGGAYVPLGDAVPADRLSYILDDAGIETVVTTSTMGRRLPAYAGRIVHVDDVRPSAAQEPARPTLTAENLAYVIYTSGTTGRPKGVAVPHRAAARIVRSGRYGDFGPGETFLQACSLSFDASVFEIWACLANGSRLVLLPDRRPTPEAIVDTVRLFGVTTLWLTPSLFNQMIDTGMLDDCPLRQLVIGGELLSTAHVTRAMRSLGARLANGYGPTEAGVFTCCHQFEVADLALVPPPVGRPLPRTSVWVLDEELRPVPDGQPGELCIGGEALARGYHRRPGLTAAAFLPNPFAGEAGARLYRSGDLARVLPSGLIQVLGRSDGQVKIRGHRVEVAEVEAVLAEQGDVAQAVVIGRDHGGERTLAAFVVPAPGAGPTVSALRERMARRLPEYMIPSEFFQLGEFPLTRHGKVDRSVLREGVGAPQLALGTGFARSTTELEATIAAVWSEVLEGRSIGIDDNYFDLGGTSLSISRVRERLARTLDLSLPSTALYEHPTVRELARAIAAGTVTDPL